jgi:hypothetical protein
MGEDYRSRPCPNCGIRPDETADPMGALETCIRESVRRVTETALLHHLPERLRERAPAMPSWSADLEYGRRRFAQFAAAEEAARQDEDWLLNLDTGEVPPTHHTEG